MFAWTVLGLLPSVAVVAATEALLRFAVAPNDPRVNSFTLMETGTARNAAFGDSQMMSFLTDIPGTLNLAFFGENTAIMESRVRIYFADRQPGRVLLQATPNMFSEEREQSAISDWTRNYQDALRQGSDYVLYSMQPQHRLYIREYWETWLTKGKFEFHGRIMPDGAFFQTTAVPQRYSEDAFRKAAEERVRVQRPLAQFTQLRTYESYLGTLAFLRQRGAQVCLVTTPFPPAYRMAADRYPEFAAVRAHFDALARRFGFSRLDLWDALDDNASFTDTDHLTLEAGRKWSRIALDRCFGRAR